MKAGQQMVRIFPVFAAVGIVSLAGIVDSCRANTITLNKPAAGTVMYVGDTVNVQFSADNEYLAMALGTKILLTPDSVHWFMLPTLEQPDFPPVDKNKAYWGNVHIVVPDSLQSSAYVDNSGKPVKYSPVSEKVYFRLADYSDALPEYIGSQPMCIRLRGSDTSQTGAGTDSGCGTGAAAGIMIPLGYCGAAGCRRRRRRG